MTAIHQEITNSFRTVSMALTNIIRTRHRWLDRLKRTRFSILAIDCLISSKKKRRAKHTAAVDVAVNDVVAMCFMRRLRNKQNVC